MKSVVAILPAYDSFQGGNSTKIYLSNGKVITDSRKTVTALRSFLNCYGLSLSALKDCYGKPLACKQYSPLPVNRDLVFASTKVRLPVARKDGATGYFNFLAVEDITLAENGPPFKKDQVKYLITMQGSHTIPSYNSLASIKRSIRLCHTARERYFFLHNQFSLKTDPTKHKTKNLKELSFKDRLIFKLIIDDEEDEE